MIRVALLEHMGNDLTVVNAARVSFSKRTEALRERDVSLLGYLARNGHWTPTAHPHASVHVEAPVFVARQCFKHKVGFVENEVSRRYVDEEPQCFLPDVWRARALDKKQGSAGPLPPEVQEAARQIAESAYEMALCAYEDLLGAGACPEQARMVLPQGMMTQWIWTGSLAAFARFYRLRTAPDAQAETAEVARQVGALLEPLFPNAWAKLTRGRA